MLNIFAHMEYLWNTFGIPLEYLNEACGTPSGFQLGFLVFLVINIFWISKPKFIIILPSLHSFSLWFHRTWWQGYPTYGISRQSDRTYTPYLSQSTLPSGIQVSWLYNMFDIKLHQILGWSIIMQPFLQNAYKFFMF